MHLCYADVCGVKLQLHIAIAVGKIPTFIIGGQEDNWQYVVSGKAVKTFTNAYFYCKYKIIAYLGEPFKQIESALDLAKGGDIVLSAKAWNELSDKASWRARHVGEGNVCVVPASLSITKDVGAQFRLDFTKGNFARCVFLETLSKAPPLLFNLLTKFVPKPILLSVEAEMSGVLSDILTVNVLFVNIKLTCPLPFTERESDPSATPRRVNIFDVSQYICLIVCIYVQGSCIKSYSKDYEAQVDTFKDRVRFPSVLCVDIFITLYGFLTTCSHSRHMHYFFLSLTIHYNTISPFQLHNIFSELQSCLFKHDGFLKEFSVDDKGKVNLYIVAPSYYLDIHICAGTVIVAGFGAPGTFSDEPALSSCLCATMMMEILKKHEVSAGLGIATGEVR
jgi:hypothetical protein